MAERQASDGKLPNLRWTRSTAPGHTMGYRTSHRVFTVVTMLIIAVLAFSGTFAAALWADINTAVTQQKVAVIKQAGDKQDEGIIDPYSNQAIDILLIGQDTREGDGNTSIGGSGDSVAGLHNSDTTMVLQIAADRTSVNLVSIPRDSMVDVPSCQTTNGEIPAQYYVRFNSIFANAYSYGGDLASAASCTMSAVNALTGMDIQNFMVVDFGGLVTMIDAIGGVDICIPVYTYDQTTKLDLDRGMHHLDGTQATQYARMRKGTGTDGSDVMRTTRQQYLIKQIVNTAIAKNLLTQSGQLYQLAKSALQSVQMSEGLADTVTLAGLAMSMKDLDTSRIYSQTVPVAADPLNPEATVVWADSAEDVWSKMRNHEPLVDEPQDATGTDSGTDSGASDGADSGSDGTGGADGADGAGADSGTSDGSSDGSGTDGTDGSSDGSTYDEKTGVITLADGTLVDKATGGYIDPETGAIRDAVTGQFVGLANRYIEITYCGVQY